MRCAARCMVCTSAPVRRAVGAIVRAAAATDYPGHGHPHQPRNLQLRTADGSQFSAPAYLPGAVRSQRCLYLLQAALQCGARAGKINAHKARAARPKGIAIVSRHMRMLNEKVVRCGL